jgi:hypothetical protein
MMKAERRMFQAQWRRILSDYKQSIGHRAQELAAVRSTSPSTEQTGKAEADLFARGWRLDRVVLTGRRPK